MSQIYELNQEDIKRIKFSPQVEYKYTRFANGYVVKRIETSFVNDKFLELIKKDYEAKDKDENKIKLE